MLLKLLGANMLPESAARVCMAAAAVLALLTSALTSDGQAQPRLITHVYSMQ